MLRNPVFPGERGFGCRVARARRFPISTSRHSTNNCIAHRARRQRGYCMDGLECLRALFDLRTARLSLGRYRSGRCRPHIISPIEDLCLSYKARSPVQSVTASRLRRCQSMPASSFMTASTAAPSCGLWRAIAASSVPMQMCHARPFRRREEAAAKEFAAHQTEARQAAIDRAFPLRSASWQLL